MSFIGTTINDSPTIACIAGEKLENKEFTAVAFNEDKLIANVTAGANVIGILIAEDDCIDKGNTVTVQIKDIGMWKVGEAVEAGDELTSNDKGLAVKATDGSFITAIALEGAGEANAVIRVQIIKAGYKPAAAKA